MNFYLKGAPCLVKGLIICCYKTLCFNHHYRELSLLEVNSSLPYLACKWPHHHSSLGFSWLRSPYEWRASSIAHLLYFPFLLFLLSCEIRVCFKLESNFLLPFMRLRNEPSHLDSLLS